MNPIKVILSSKGLIKQADQVYRIKKSPATRAGATVGFGKQTLAHLLRLVLINT